MRLRSRKGSRARAAVLGALLVACGTSTPHAPLAGAGSGGAASPSTAGVTASGAGGSTAGTGGAQAVGAGAPAPGGAGSAGSSNPATGGSGGAAGEAMPMPDASTPDPDALIWVPDPSWHCNLPEGIPPPATGEAVFEAMLKLDPIMELGETQYGTRRVLPITGGTISGSALEGTVLNGGLEWELTTADGEIEIEARNVVRTARGDLIYIRSCGAGTRAIDARVVLDIEAPSSSPSASLNEGTFVATREVEAGAMRLKVFKVAAKSPTPAPATLGPGDQPWDCRLPEGSVGSTPVLEAAVNIGASLAIGGSKYGRRNIIPITGGTFSGDAIEGVVIAGGADFQLTPTAGSGLQIEARYTIRTDDGELIAVRNCGGGGGTRLQFETRADGPYTYLNADGFTGTIGVRLGGVLISVFK